MADSNIRKIVYDAMEEGRRIDPEKWGGILDVAVSRLRARAQAGELGEVASGDRRRTPLTRDEIRRAIEQTASQVGMSSDPIYHAELLAENLAVRLDEKTGREVGEAPKFVLERNRVTEPRRYRILKFWKTALNGFPEYRCVLESPSEPVAMDIMKKLTSGEVTL